ncbi:MAG: hypothetical protein AAFV85_01635 [Cyanobacteria bacterium J06634_6]
MSQTLTVEISEQAFVAIKQQAEESGVAPAYLAALMLEQNLTNASNSTTKSTESVAVQADFEQYFGSLPVEQSLGADNESIDADLAKEYSGGLDISTCF